MHDFDRAVRAYLIDGKTDEPRTIEERLAVELISVMLDGNDPMCDNAIMMAIKALYRDNTSALGVLCDFYDNQPGSVFTRKRMQMARDKAVHIAGAIEWPELYEGKEADAELLAE